MKPKYKFGFVNAEEISEKTYYTYNVYKRFLFFFWKPVFSVEDTTASKCRDACRQYIIDHEHD